MHKTALYNFRLRNILLIFLRLSRAWWLGDRGPLVNVRDRPFHSLSFKTLLPMQGKMPDNHFPTIIKRSTFANYTSFHISLQTNHPGNGSNLIYWIDPCIAHVRSSTTVLNVRMLPAVEGCVVLWWRQYHQEADGDDGPWAGVSCRGYGRTEGQGPIFRGGEPRNE